MALTNGMTEADVINLYLQGRATTAQVQAAFQQIHPEWLPWQVQAMMNSLDLQKAQNPYGLQDPGVPRSPTVAGLQPATPEPPGNFQPGVPYGAPGGTPAPGVLSTPFSAAAQERYGLGPTYQQFLLGQNYRTFNPLAQAQMESQAGNWENRYNLNRATGNTRSFADFLAAEYGGAGSDPLTGVNPLVDILRRMYGGGTEPLTAEEASLGKQLGKPGEGGAYNTLASTLGTASYGRVAPVGQSFLQQYLADKAQDFAATNPTANPYLFTQFLRRQGLF